MSSIVHLDGNGDPVLVEVENGSEGGGQVRVVHGVPTAVTSPLAAIAASAADIETAVDQLEGYLDGVETKLDSVITGVTALATPPTPANSYGQGSVGTSATQIASGASLALKYGIRIKNLHATQDLYVGFDNSTSNTTGVKLRAGEEAPFVVNNRNVIYLYGSGSSTTYCYWTA
jgi:hypothetical protein